MLGGRPPPPLCAPQVCVLNDGRAQSEELCTSELVNSVLDKLIPPYSREVIAMRSSPGAVVLLNSLGQINGGGEEIKKSASSRVGARVQRFALALADVPSALINLGSRSSSPLNEGVDLVRLSRDSREKRREFLRLALSEGWLSLSELSNKSASELRVASVTIALPFISRRRAQIAYRYAFLGRSFVLVRLSKSMRPNHNTGSASTYGSGLRRRRDGR